jgi:hypothetical protein
MRRFTKLWRFSTASTSGGGSLRQALPIVVIVVLRWRNVGEEEGREGQGEGTVVECRDGGWRVEGAKYLKQLG